MSRTRMITAALFGLLALTGCGFKGAYSLPLPGGNAGGASYHVTAVFDDVQDLVPMSAVRVNDVAVGDVTSINYDPRDGKAHVGMRIKKSVHLPLNAEATLEQTTLLGEKYIALSAPVGNASGTLADGSTITATSHLPDVEELFGVLSAVLNGGDLQDLQTIDFEISKALGGREQAVRSALTQIDTFVSGLNSQKQNIVHALDELNRFSGALAKQSGTIATALDDLGPGLRVLADERVQFTGLLTDLSRFGKIATHIITASRQQTVAGLRDLQPILRHLRASGTNLPHALELLITYPFPRNIDKAVPGDYNGLYLSFNADPIFCALTPPPVPVTCSGSATAGSGTASKPTKPGTGGQKPGLPGLPRVPDVPNLPVPLPSPGDLLGDLLGAGLPGGGGA
ncbi:MAG: phospholipid/cholesterol/gamma-HCH transport system substrate-binding protein [Frankiaceae bacterium]|nr:phospholipid/cholesterol/gamma-HCH transport system substrate-binding protein [Frankiaceae bacterium]